MISCNIEKVGQEITACSQSSLFLPSAITEETFESTIPDELSSGSLNFSSVPITIDNLLSPSHTLVQIICSDHKGLLYDIMRTLKDYSIQVSALRIPELNIINILKKIIRSYCVLCIKISYLIVF